MKRLNDVEVKIVKMKESSGNEQFFVRLVRTDEVKKIFSVHGTLEYHCWQTKNVDKHTCLKNAWFDASLLARFAGLSSMEEVKLCNLDEEEQALIKTFRGMIK